MANDNCIKETSRVKRFSASPSPNMKHNVANEMIFRKNTDEELLVQRHKSWTHSQPTWDEGAAPLNYLQLKNKESVARWREKINALAASGKYPYGPC